jgi:transglutaminase-like putative cysteine protease
LIYRVSHLTEYVYRQPVSTSHHQLHLLPRAHKHQVNRWEELSVDPMPARQQQRVDYFGNRTTHLEIQEPHRRLAVLCRSEIELAPHPAPVPAATPPWEVVRDRVRQDISPDQLEAYEFSFASPYVQVSPGILDFASKSFPPGRPVGEAAIDLMHRIHDEFVYDSTATNVSTPVEEVLTHRRGVCQDFAHLALSCLRVLGLPGRYVSGYLVTAVPGQPRLVGADASHAWLQVYCLRRGSGEAWMDLDPTNNVVPSDKHITVALGRDFGDVTPLQGVILGGGRHTLRVVVDVAPLSQNLEASADTQDHQETQEPQDPAPPDPEHSRDGERRAGDAAAAGREDPQGIDGALPKQA